MLFGGLIKNIILAGSSGLVGGFVLNNLLKDNRVEKIILVSRTSHNIINPKIIQIIGSLDLLDLVKLQDFGIDHIDAGLCTLGSTIKKSGNKDAFKKVDKDFVINIAKFAKKYGATQFSVISSLGANAKSPIFYNQVKGEMEADLQTLNFKKLTIFRPSVILGERQDIKSGERFLNRISPFLNITLVGPLRKYRGIEAHKVAHNLAQSIYGDKEGVIIIENSEMLNV